MGEPANEIEGRPVPTTPRSATMKLISACDEKKDRFGGQAEHSGTHPSEGPAHTE